jgi:hypothetical protein
MRLTHQNDEFMPCIINACFAFLEIDREANTRVSRQSVRAAKSSFVAVIPALLPTLALGQTMRCGSELIT